MNRRCNKLDEWGRGGVVPSHDSVGPPPPSTQTLFFLSQPIMNYPTVNPLFPNTKEQRFCDDHNSLQYVDCGLLKMEAICSSETLITTYKLTRRHHPEDHNRHVHRRENLKFQIVTTWWPNAMFPLELTLVVCLLVLSEISRTSLNVNSWKYPACVIIVLKDLSVRSRYEFWRQIVISHPYNKIESCNTICDM
jgi:hypothetical protein